MLKNDAIIKAIDKEKQIRIWAAATTNLVREAQERHQATPLAATALGKVLTAAVMLAADLKAQDNIITLRVDGKGAAGTIIATANCAGQVRGFINNPEANLPFFIDKPAKTGNIIGNQGVLEISKDLGLQYSYNGRVALVNGEIDDDLVYYLHNSEQVTSAAKIEVCIGSNLDIVSAGGILIQAMPQCEELAMLLVKKNLDALSESSNIFQSYSDLEELIARLMAGMEYSILQKDHLEFKCNCSAQRLLNIIRSLSTEEVEYLSADQDEIEICCNFCNCKYTFSREEVLYPKTEH